MSLACIQPTAVISNPETIHQRKTTHWRQDCFSWVELDFLSILWKASTTFRLQLLDRTPRLFAPSARTRDRQPWILSCQQLVEHLRRNPTKSNTTQILRKTSKLDRCQVGVICESTDSKSRANKSFCLQHSARSFRYFLKSHIQY